MTIKKKATILIIAITVIMVVLTSVVLVSMKNADDDAVLLNALGRQRMLSQAMAKSILGYAMAEGTLKKSEMEVANLDGYITKMRTLYTNSVIGAAKKAGLKISMSPDSESHPAVPFPATFTRFVNENFGTGSDLKVDILAKDPINKNQGLRDGTDQEAHDYLINNKGSIFYRPLEEGGRLFLRFYTADKAAVEACAECHSKMQNKNFVVGDMLGVRRFTILFSADATVGKIRLNPSREEYERAVSVFDKTLKAVKGGGAIPLDLTMTEQRTVAAIDNKMVQVKISEIEKEFAAFLQHVATLTSAAVGSETYWSAQNQIQLSSNVLRKVSDDLVLLYENIASANQTYIKWAVIVMALTAIIAFMGLYLFIRNAIIAPLGQVIGVAHAIEKGDLTSDLNLNRSDEIGNLSDALNGMSRSLNMIVSKIASTSGMLASSTEEISAASSQMVAGAESQTKQTDQVATAIEEMSATVLEVARNSNAATDLAKKASEVAVKGGDIVKQTILGMNGISTSVRDSARTIEELGKSSDQIGEIVEVIDEIADQTNLLALNAAIEAARAGDQGRGFAVVADEVRKLAERTTRATKEIAAMIKRIQSETGGAVNSMRAGTEEVDKGVERANEAGDSLRQIVEVVASVNDMIRQIAAAAEQQSVAAEQISGNVEMVATISKESTASAQQSSVATNELSKLAQELKDMVGHFRTK